MFEHRFFYPRTSAGDDARHLVERDPARTARRQLTRSVDHGVIRPQMRRRVTQPAEAR
jgi:hypothetical protein